MRGRTGTPLPETTATGEEPLTPGLGKGRKGARGAATAERSVAFEAMRVYIDIYACQEAWEASGPSARSRCQRTSIPSVAKSGE